MSSTGQSRTATLDLTIAEPNPALTKGAAPGTVSGGETVTFTVTFTNTNATAVTRGWEPYLEDVLPARYQNPGLISATLSRGAQDVSGCAGVSSQTVAVDLTGSGPGCLPAAERYLGPGENVVLIYTATVDPEVGLKETVLWYKDQGWI